jgi:uncharacterized small protein (DUF1192 family)
LEAHQAFKPTKLIEDIMELLYADEIQERRALLAAEQQLQLQDALPLFVCALVWCWF